MIIALIKLKRLRTTFCFSQKDVFFRMEKDGKDIFVTAFNSQITFASIELTKHAP